MSRIRTIKPGFFFNEELAMLPAETRLFFIGLWTQVDREGRCEDRPARLKANLFPYEAVDVDTCIRELAAHGHVVRYEVDGAKILAIPNFLKHQIPHYKEVPSILPGIPADFKVKSTMTQHQVIVDPMLTQPCTQEGKGREQEGKGTVLAKKPAKVGGLVNPQAETKSLTTVNSEPLTHKPETPIQAVVRAYKHSKGVGQDNKAWDKANFGRASKSAKSLLDRFAGDVDEAAAYLFVRAEQLNEKGLEWTLETIARHAWDGAGMPKQEEQSDGRKDSPLGSDRLDGPGRTRRITSSREAVGDALQGLRDAIVLGEGARQLGGPPEDSHDDEPNHP